jgi:hypothetical protein
MKFMKKGIWIERSYRRNLVDMHIEDWDERFLSQFEPKNYVEMLKLANVKSAMVYANSHVGYCYWPTKSGVMHKGIKGRDVLGEICELCHKAGIDVILYYTLVFNNWAYERDPQWRVLNIFGNPSRGVQSRAGRYGVCCPNSSGYRKFVLDQINELCQNYDFEGIFFDMTFWPDVCYCPNCRSRYSQEVGGDLPTVVNWDDPSWIRFQKKREEWLAEFAAMATGAIKKFKPEVTVEHQYSVVASSWKFCATLLLAEQCDYLGGDLYGDVLQQSFACKLFYNLTRNLPFEYMTSFCYPSLFDHTTTKTKELIESRAFMTLAHNGAFLIIDAIDPIGTLEERKYRMMGDIYRETSKYEKYLGGELCQDVAIYFSFDSKMDFAENGKKVAELLSFMNPPHLDAALGAAEALRTNHIPFGIISKKNLKELSRHQVVILPNVLKLSDEEVDAIKEYVANGGSVYASKFTLRSKLSEMLGVSSFEETPEKFTYIAPTPEGDVLLPETTREHPLSIFDSQIMVSDAPRDGVMATITLPYTSSSDTSKFVSIHSNPPGIPTDYPAIIYREIGEGRIIWSSASIEANAVKSLKHRAVFVNIIKYLARKPFSFEAAAPECVEIVQFHKPDEKRYLINLVNFQSEIGTPNIPIQGIVLKVKIDRKPSRVLSLPEEKSIPFKREGEHVTIDLPVLQTFRMLALDYK